MFLLSVCALLPLPVVPQQIHAPAPAAAHRGPVRWSPRTPTFGPGVDFDVAGEFAGDTQVADFDRDGFLDLAVSSFGGEVTILYGDGTGSLADNENFWAIQSPYDPGPGGISSADYDGNGYPDLAIAVAGAYNGLGQTVRKALVYLTDADRNWTYASTLFTTAPFANDTASGDFNEDGRADVAVVSNGGLDVFLGNGDGTFGPALPLASPPPPTGFQLRAADVDRDGHLDLIGGFGSNYPSTHIYWGDGTGAYDLSTLAGPGHQSASVHLDRDGYLDTLVVALNKLPNYSGGLWITPGAPRPFVPSWTRVGAAFRMSGKVVAADLNGDGFGDALATDVGGQRLFLGGPGGRLREVPNTTRVATAPGVPTVGDWNQDGRPDLAFVWEIVGKTPKVRVFLNRTP